METQILCWFVVLCLWLWEDGGRGCQSIPFPLCVFNYAQMSWPAAGCPSGTCLVKKNKLVPAWKKKRKKKTPTTSPNDSFVCMFVIHPAPLFKVYKEPSLSVRFRLFCRCFYSTCRLSREPQWLMSISVLTSFSSGWVGTGPARMSHLLTCRLVESFAAFLSSSPPVKEIAPLANMRSRPCDPLAFEPFDLWTADPPSLKGTRWTCTRFRTVRAKHTPAGTWLEDVKAPRRLKVLSPESTVLVPDGIKVLDFSHPPRGLSFKSYRGSLSSIENWSLVRPQMLWVALKLGDLGPSTLHLLSSFLLWSSTVCLCFHVSATSPSFLPVSSPLFSAVTLAHCKMMPCWHAALRPHPEMFYALGRDFTSWPG